MLEVCGIYLAILWILENEGEAYGLEETLRNNSEDIPRSTPWNAVGVEDIKFPLERWFDDISEESRILDKAKLSGECSRKSWEH